MSAESKLQLYNRIMATRDELRPEEVEQMSREAQQRVLGMQEFRTALRVGLYAAFKNEVRTELLFIEGDKHRKEIYFPAVDRAAGGLDYFRVMRLEDLLPASTGFREPTAKQSRLRDLNNLNVLIVPGVAFDHEGRRMGFGKGFYDDCLSRFRGKRVGLAYDFQVVTTIPGGIKAHGVDWIVTEKRVIRCA
jgi:5-formyltetrahydrofolate cyclo-ligase